MTDLEQDIRELLDEMARSAPQPHEAAGAIGRTRRRQALTIVGGALGVLAVVAVSVVGLRAVLTADRGTPAVQPTVTTTINGISITHPEGWFVVDPDEAGLNGPAPESPPTLPRLVLAVSPVDPQEAFGCPGVADGAASSLLMTIQEEPLALSGASSAAWPGQLEPLSVGSSESACYPGWEFLRAGWTAAGRTFEARVGFAPDASDVDREALVAAFASLTFEPVRGAPTSVVLATGTAGDEDWELIATRGSDGLQLAMQARMGATGTGGFDPDSEELQLTSMVLGSSRERERLIFGAVPPEVVRVGVRVVADDEGLVDVLDVPDTIDARFNAFVVSLLPQHDAVIYAYDTAGRVVATGVVRSELDEPTDEPPPRPDEALPEHGGTYWGLYLSVAASPADLNQAAFDRATVLGYTPSVGDVACDQGAAEELGVDPNASRTAVYFATREEAESAAAWLVDLPPVGIARVTTYCLD